LVVAAAHGLPLLRLLRELVAKAQGATAAAVAAAAAAAAAGTGSDVASAAEVKAKAKANVEAARGEERRTRALLERVCASPLVARSEARLAALQGDGAVVVRLPPPLATPPSSELRPAEPGAGEMAEAPPAAAADRPVACPACGDTVPFSRLASHQRCAQPRKCAVTSRRRGQ